MKKGLFFVVVALLMLVGCEKSGDVVAQKNLANVQDSFSYVFGMDMATMIEGNNLTDELNLDVVAQAMYEYLHKADLKISRDEATAITEAVRTRLQAEMEAKALVAVEENTKLGEAFLAENKAKEGVVTTESGLQYEVITKGEGAIPTLESTVEVHYVGTLLDGTEFDSSRKRGQTTKFPVGGVIKGWTEALQLMPVGSTYKIVVPSDIAYGAQGGGPIPPNSTLIFEIELVSIIK